MNFEIEIRSKKVASEYKLFISKIYPLKHSGRKSQHQSIYVITLYRNNSGFGKQAIEVVRHY